MLRFKGFLSEMANTDSADINEIQLGYFLSNNWKNFDDPGAAHRASPRVLSRHPFHIQHHAWLDDGDGGDKYSHCTGVLLISCGSFSSNVVKAGAERCINESCLSRRPHGY